MRWAADDAVAALRQWAAQHERQPVFREWDPAPPGCPARTTIVKLFGSWSAAMAAAGFAARGPGEYPRVRKVHPERRCGICGRRFRKPRRFKFCSPECGGIAAFRAAGGRRSSSRYRTSARRTLHREIAARWLGRELGRGEVVHHVNGDRTDNRIANLAVMTPSAHTLLHCGGGEVVALDGTRYLCEPLRGSRQPGPLNVTAAERG